MSNTIETNKVTSDVFNMDCVEYMRTLPDNFFDIAICAPPSGDAASGDFQFGGAVWRTIRPLQAATNYPHTHNQQQQADQNPHTRRNVVDKIPAPVNHAYGGRFSRYSGGGKLTANYNVLTGMLPLRKSFSMNFSA